MIKWEYMHAVFRGPEPNRSCVVNGTQLFFETEVGPEQTQAKIDWLNYFGSEGWELVKVGEDDATFKRPMSNSNE